jgi:hypothetical protein
MICEIFANLRRGTGGAFGSCLRPVAIRSFVASAISPFSSASRTVGFPYVGDFPGSLLIRAVTATSVECWSYCDQVATDLIKIDHATTLTRNQSRVKASRILHQ